ncbi:vWA domain-containing protein [Candidatus Methanocrinis alkalitolerans]|uniref:vWA domain-containing protein n=1 Tax=Candidatus Methanocrinis alkalitolerans TaxID=3033395 RepID=UPI002934BEC0|nr:VWA domain-containing protein [Candidatus Methanocrinis alkalitolerans]
MRNLLVSILCLSSLAFASSFVQPHLNVTYHDVSPNPICIAGSGTPCESVVKLKIEGLGDPRPVQVVLSIDSSSSMFKYDSNKTRLDAARGFIGVLDNRSDKVGLVIWSDQVIEAEPPTSNFESVNRTISGIISYGATDLYYGLKPAIEMFENESVDHQKHIILLTDGTTRARDPEDYLSEVYRAKEAGIKIWTIGFPADEAGELVLKNISELTAGNYSTADNATVENVFIKIYKDMTSLAGNNVTVRYVAPGDLIYFLQDAEVEGDDKVFTWKPTVDDGSGPRNHFYIGERWSKTFAVRSENTGLFPLGKPGSEMTYSAQNTNGSYIPMKKPIEERTLEVIPCNDTDCNNTYIKIFINCSLNFTGDIAYLGEGSSLHFNLSFPWGPDGRPWHNCPDDGLIVIKSPCVNHTDIRKEPPCLVCPPCPKCPDANLEEKNATSKGGSKENTINIVQTAIFGSTPYWNGTDEPAGVINLTVSRPDAAIDAVFAFDVSGSMRLPYEEMGEEVWAAFAEANFSNVSIIGWDEDDGEGADPLMVPLRPLEESEEEVLAALSNLSGLCDETDLTVYSAGLRGVMEVDYGFGDHFDGDEKIVLFITGPDEFQPGEGLDSLAIELKRRGYAIYPVGMEIDEFESPLKYESLSTMASITGGRFYSIGGLDSEELREVLQDAAAHASSRAAPKDIVVTETLPAHQEVKETVPSGAEVNVAKNPDGTTTITWTASGVRPGEARSLIILTAVKGALASDAISNAGWPGGINITATGGDAAGVNVINLRTEEGDVKIGEIS